ncbi:MAG: hypothetical protein ABIL58_05465 [Pseudomonadota bacterium]
MKNFSQHHLNAAIVRLRQAAAISLAAAVLFSSTWAWASSEGAPATRQVIPSAVITGLKGLLDAVGSAPTNEFLQTDAAAVIDFVEKTPSKSVLFSAGDAFPEASAYHRFDVKQDMTEFLKLAFSPDIPSYALMPSSVRFCQWRAADGKEAPFPILWTDLDTLNAPRIIRGVESMENTPDTFSGAYYTYDLYRTMIMMRHRGRPVLISLSKQTDVSETGKKGVVLGDDDNWAYLYSDQNGISKPGLGWVKSYMYDSYSVSVYVQSEDSPGWVKCGVFKWIRAGWSSINMVKPEHIYSGLVRYGNSFSSVINDPRLPNAQQMSAVFATISRYSTEELREKFRVYLQMVERSFGRDASFPRGWFDEWFQSSTYLERVTKDQMRATLVVEYIRQLLGKPPCIDLSELMHVRPRVAG